MSPERAARMYPRLNEWRAVRDSFDPAGVSVRDLARRLHLIAREGGAPARPGQLARAVRVHAVSNAARRRALQ